MEQITKLQDALEMGAIAHGYVRCTYTRIYSAGENVTPFFSLQRLIFSENYGDVSAFRCDKYDPYVLPDGKTLVRGKGKPSCYVV